MEKALDVLKVSMPYPLIIIDEEGKVVAYNDKVGDVFIYENIIGIDVFALTAITANDIKQDAENNNHREIERNEKIFRLSCFKDIYDEKDAWFIIFLNITPYSELRERYTRERPCSIKIEIDNYDELVYPNGEDPNLSLASNLDKLVRSWAQKYDIAINRLSGGNYGGWFESEKLSRMVEDKFDILDEVRNVDTGLDFQASLSIGIGTLGKTINETEEFSDDALDLALGRGGDQVVVKKSQKMEYYGGKLQAKGIGSKGKSRMIGIALKQLIVKSKNVIIMGHRNGDMDSFGASLGIYRFCKECEKEAYIAIDEVSESLEGVYNEAKLDDYYNIVSSERALNEAEGETLLIVLDTHRKSLVQAPKLLDVCEKVVVIDHHRRMEDMIDNPTLQYMETYASSASEMVTEILEFMTENKKVRKFEAEALLSGIMIDTDRFIMKTGVRTFEAAQWLRRQGANPTEVQRFFQEEFDLVKVKSLALIKAEILKENTVAITTLDYISTDSQILCAQIADELLTLKGIKCSFVIGNNGRETVVSARSLGEVNVQVMMEKLGGGGHLTVAATQSSLSIEEIKCKILEILGI